MRGVFGRKVRDCHPQENHDYTEYIHDILVKRFDDNMKWIGDVERKAASLIAVNGVVLALEVTLISLLMENLSNNEMTLQIPIIIPIPCLIILLPILIRWLTIPVMTFTGILLCLELFCIFVSLVSAAISHRISTYQVSNIKSQVKIYEKSHSENKWSAVKQSISNYEAAINEQEVILSRKSECTSMSQNSFVVGGIILILLLITTYWFGIM